MASFATWIALGSVGSMMTAALIWVPRELWRRWRARLVDRVDRVVKLRVTAFPKLYRDHMLRTLRFVDLKGLATLSPSHPELDDVFVDVSLEHQAPHQVEEGVLSHLPGDIADRRWLGDFVDLQQPQVLAVLGAPGSGKTTLVRYTARQISQTSRGRRRPVAILLYLRDHVASIVAQPAISLPELVLHQLGELGRKEPSGWLEQQLVDGHCVVLLDGLDEVARRTDRRVIADWVEHQTRQYSKNDFVITSRPHGYRTAPVDGASVLQVRGFTGEQVTRFVRGWYQAICQNGAGNSDEDIKRRALLDADDLLQRLENAPELGDLTVNPLLLTMIANVHRYRGALPGNRVELYSEICQVMLWRRQEAKQLPIELNGERKEAILRGLAFRMMRQQFRDMQRETVLDELRTALRRISTTISAEDLLLYLSSNGLLIEREADLYCFAHLTFQEYLAAMHVRDTGAIDVLADSVDDVWWRETTLLYAARSAADPIVAACLDSGSVTALALAFDIADDGDLAPELRARLEAELTLSDNDSARERLRAGVRVTRDLRRTLVRTRTGGRVCGTPVNREIYELFLAEGHVPMPDAAPLASPLANPAVGMWASDAAAFVHWVNDVTNSVPGYRLIAASELEELTRTRVLLEEQVRSVWLHPESGRPSLLASTESAHSNIVNAATLSRHVDGDMARLVPILYYLATQHADGPWDRKRLLAAVGFARSLEREPVLYEIYGSGESGQPEDVEAGLLGNEFIEHLIKAVICGKDIARDVDVVSVLHHQSALTRGLRGAIQARGDLKAELLGFPLLSFMRRVITKKDVYTQLERAWFEDAFKRATIDPNFSQIVTLDALGVKVASATEEMCRVRSRVLPKNAQRVASQFAESALPAVTRIIPMTADLATSLRVSALCLAAELDHAEVESIGDRYRELAAGITLLERRVNGQTPAAETMILAIS
jgi:hypothetical protein